MLLYLYYIYVEVHLNDLRRNHVDAETNEDEFDRELFEPVQNGENGDEAAMDSSHGLHDENLNDDDGIIQWHAQGTTTASIWHPTSLYTSLHKPYIYSKVT